MDVQQRRLSRVHTAAQRRLDQTDIVEALGPVQIDDEVHAGAAHAVANGKMPFAPLGGGGLDHGDMSDVLSGSAWSCQALPRSQEGVLAHVRPPQPSDPTRVPTSGVRQANAADQPVRKRTDHSGRSPHKAHAPGVKKILLRRGLETPSVPWSDALSAWLARPNRAHSSNRGHALPRRRVTRRVDCLRPRESLFGHNRGRDVAAFDVAAFIGLCQRSSGAPSPEPGTRPEPTLSSQHNNREERDARQFHTQVFPHVPVL